MKLLLLLNFANLAVEVAIDIEVAEGLGSSYNNKCYFALYRNNSMQSLHLAILTFVWEVSN